MERRGTKATKSLSRDSRPFVVFVVQNLVNRQDAVRPGLLANPPFGVEWRPEADVIRREHDQQGYGGRFGAGLPRINDGSLLFLQHMISKMKPPEKGGTRLAIVFNGSPLFTGAAGSGESNIRRWIIENDWLEAIVALPDQLFYNTGTPAPSSGGDRGRPAADRARDRRHAGRGDEVRERGGAPHLGECGAPGRVEVPR